MGCGDVLVQCSMCISDANPIQQFHIAVCSMSQVLLPFSYQADFVVCFAQGRCWKTLVQLQRNLMADEVVSVQCSWDVVTLCSCSLTQTSTTEQATFVQHMRLIEAKLETGLNLRWMHSAHRSAITSGCAGWSFKSSCCAASSSASDKCFPLYLGCSNLRGSGYQ